MVQSDNSSTEQRGPGVALRAARESAGLSIEQVADKLHLLQSVVRSLEADTYERIRGEAFVRGYLRNYARLLGLDGDEILVRYRVSQTGARKAAATGSASERWRGPRGAGRVGMVLALLGLSALFLFHNREPQAAVPEPGVAEVTVETANGTHVVPLLDPPAPAVFAAP